MMHKHPDISVSLPSTKSQSTKRTLNETQQENSEDSCNKLTDTSQSSTKRLKTVTDEANVLEKRLTQDSPNDTSPKSTPKMQLTSTTPTSSKRCQTRIDTAFAVQKSFQDGGTKSTEAINRLLFMIAKDKMPYITVENEGFKTFIKYIAPLFKVPSRLTITRLMQDKYDVLSEIIKTELSTVQSISLTADIWTDTLNNKSYLGVTSHYIFDNKQKSIMIGVTALADHHTADNIKSWLLTIIQDWRIDMDNIVAFVSDNAANIKKAIIDGFGGDKWLPCLAHTLNLIPAKLIKSDIISAVNSKVKGIVKYFKQSVAAADALRLVSDLMLIQSIDTRWNSSYDMYERFTALSDKIAPILLKSPSAPDMLSGSELKIVQEFVELLRPFKEATKIVSGEKYITGSQAIPVVKNLKLALDSLDVDTDLGKQIKKLLIDDYIYRFGKIENMSTIAMATILDPRFKRLYFSDKLACSSAVNKITKLLNDVILETSKASCENNPNNHQNNSTDIKSNNFWAHHEKLVLENHTSKMLTHSQTEMPENLRYYLSQPVININADPILFWTQSSDLDLPKIAIRYLSVISTSVPSERLFSRAGIILTDKRNRLTPEHFQNLLFLSTLSSSDWRFN